MAETDREVGGKKVEERVLEVKIDAADRAAMALLPCLLCVSE